MLTARFVHTDVQPASTLDMANVPAEGAATSGTPDVLNGIHHMVRYSQMANLWSVPTDCPQVKTTKRQPAPRSTFDTTLSFLSVPSCTCILVPQRERRGKDHQTPTGTSQHF